MSPKVSSICLKVLPVAGFLLLLQPLSAQYNWTKLDAELIAKQKLLENNIVAIIWKNDSLVYKKEMGDFNSKIQAPIASCSKWLTAAHVMQFADEGKISLDDPIVKYLPSDNTYVLIASLRMNYVATNNIDKNNYQNPLSVVSFFTSTTLLRSAL